MYTIGLIIPGDGNGNLHTGDDLRLCIAGDGDIVWLCGVTRNLDHVVAGETAFNASLSFNFDLYLARS